MMIFPADVYTHNMHMLMKWVLGIFGENRMTVHRYFYWF